LYTNDQFSSNWISWVAGGKSHELVVELLGVFAHPSAVANHRIAVHAHQPRGGSHPGAVGQVFDHRDGLLLGQARSEQGCPLPLREPGFAGPAVEEPMVLGLAVAATNSQIAVAPLARIGAIRVLTAEAGQVLLHGRASLILGWVKRGL
jgi:hypothetical protein